MKMKSAVLVFSAVVVLFAASCGVPEVNTKVAGEVEKLQVNLIATDSALKKIDAEKSEELAEIIKNNSQFIQGSMNKIGDTIDFKTGLLLTDYRSLYKDFEVVKKNCEGLSRAIDSTQMNLSNLISDLKSNTLAPGLTPDSALAYETRQAAQLDAYVRDIQTRYNNAQAAYDTLAPRVEVYIEGVKARTNTAPMPLPAKGKGEK
ncbi:MAG: hypothetical protein ACRC3B_01120 [Bacteroidia bacterium]